MKKQKFITISIIGIVIVGALIGCYFFINKNKATVELAADVGPKESPAELIAQQDVPAKSDLVDGEVKIEIPPHIWGQVVDQYDEAVSDAEFVVLLNRSGKEYYAEGYDYNNQGEIVGIKRGTDKDGHFVFYNVPTGEYVLGSEKITNGENGISYITGFDRVIIKQEVLNLGKVKIRKIETKEFARLIGVAIDDMTIIEEALAEYARDRGIYPDGLDSLVPDYLSFMLLNPLTGKKYFYVNIDECGASDNPLTGFIPSDLEALRRGERCFYKFKKEAIGACLREDSSCLIPLDEMRGINPDL